MKEKKGYKALGKQLLVGAIAVNMVVDGLGRIYLVTNSRATTLTPLPGIYAWMLDDEGAREAVKNKFSEWLGRDDSDEEGKEPSIKELIKAELEKIKRTTQDPDERKTVDEHDVEKALDEFEIEKAYYETETIPRRGHTRNAEWHLDGIR